MRRLMLIALAASTVAGPALAELPPYVYEQARDEATAVVVVRVTSVGGLAAGVTEGACALEGVVTTVERGDAHALGDRLKIDVPCVSAEWTPRPGPFPGYSEAPLAKVSEARLWLTNGELVLRGLDDAAAAQPATP